jgi:hypothetical protein
VGRNFKEVITTNNATNNRIVRCSWQSAFENREIVLALVKSKAKLKLMDVIKSRVKKAELTINLDRMNTAECEIRCDESERLIGPWTCMS